MSMDVLGHEGVIRRFDQARACGRLHHAWLLHGPHGIGKTTLARTLARRYLCDHGNACGACHGCRMMAAEAHPDFLLVEPLPGKRDLAIAQVREALAFLALSGLESARRVVIVDDAERMNLQAANALLKGLEEPAAGSLLFIVCSELTRLPATIRSRCLLMPCASVTPEIAEQVWSRMGLDARFFPLARKLGEGTPGRASCLLEAGVAEALENWTRIGSNAAQADVGQVEAWLRRHLDILPPALVAELTVRAHLDCLQGERDFGRRKEIETALLAMARWPQEVARHTLRRAPTFLAAFLHLRAALRS